MKNRYIQFRQNVLTYSFVYVTNALVSYIDFFSYAFTHIVVIDTVFHLYHYYVTQLSLEIHFE